MSDGWSGQPVSNPQLENGFTKVAHEIMEALAKVNLSPYESRVLWFVLRKTYGWKKKSDWIAGSQFRSGLGGLDRRHIWRAQKSLANRHIIVISTDDRGRPIYAFQKDYSKWCASSLQAHVISTDDKRHLYRHTVSSVEAHTKDTLTKEKILRSPQKRAHADPSVNGKGQSKKPNGSVPGFKEAMAAYHDLFVSKFGAKPDIDGRDGKLLSGLLRAHGADEVGALLRFFFEHPPAWVEKNSKFTIPAFKFAYTEILAQSRRPQHNGGFAP